MMRCFPFIILLQVVFSTIKDDPLSITTKDDFSSTTIDELSTTTEENLFPAEKEDLVLILTDDQDVQLFGMTPMTQTKELLAKQGVTFKHAYVTTPVCCPSRASILTGTYAHYHRTKNNSRSGGCNNKHWIRKWEPNTIGPLLQSLGYVTFYAGKYLNQYKGNKRPVGWDWWNGLVGNSQYYNYKLLVNDTLKSYGQNYLTSVIWRKVEEFLQYADRNRPFFLFIAPPAPHAPFTPEKRYSSAYNDTKAPRLPNYNVPGKNKHWIVRNAPPMTPRIIDFVDDVYRNRWRTLLSVDDLVGNLVRKLDALGRLEKTNFIYSSDNGFHSGQFSLPTNKRQPYEFDINVPFIVRGPRFPINRRIEYKAVLNIDIAPTLLDLAGAKELAQGMDGKSVLDLIAAPKLWRKEFLVEYWGEENVGIPAQCSRFRNKGVAECHPGCICADARNNTYTCIRRVGRGTDWLWCEFQDKESYVEMYRLRRDPYQLHNTLRAKKRALWKPRLQEISRRPRR